jgi:hypothetical protein
MAKTSPEKRKAAPASAAVGGLIAVERQKVKQMRVFPDG